MHTSTTQIEKSKHTESNQSSTPPPPPPPPRTFMETCMNAKIPPRNVTVGPAPHLYYSIKEVEKEWRDTLATILTSLIKHYTKIIEEEKQALEEILNSEN